MRRLTHTFSVIMVSLLIQPGNVSAAPETSTLPDTFPDLGGLESPPVDSGLPPAYPKWPDRPARREFIPPPPAGPLPGRQRRFGYRAASLRFVENNG